MAPMTRQCKLTLLANLADSKGHSGDILEVYGPGRGLEVIERGGREH